MARLYRNIDVYNLSYTFVLDLYRITTEFPKSEENNITSQIRRAAVSIPLNIAEGSAKASNKEFTYFLNVAYASAKEVEVLLELCHDLKYTKSANYSNIFVRTFVYIKLVFMFDYLSILVYLNEDAFVYLSHRLDEINAKLFLFIRNIESKIGGKRYHFFKKFEGPA